LNKTDSVELQKWQDVKNRLGQANIALGPYFSYQLTHTPRRVLFSLSHYKFAAKLIGEGKKVLEVGCSEGLGTVFIAENAKEVVAIDIDMDAIAIADKNFASPKIKFMHQDILEAKIDLFDAIVSYDVLEHIFPENEALFFTALCNNLSSFGICIIGTPNLAADCYSSEISRLGHVNVFDWERLKTTMEQYFHQVFIFSANDEVIHTGFYPMAHYLIAVAVCKKN